MTKHPEGCIYLTLEERSVRVPQPLANKPQCAELLRNLGRAELELPGPGPRAMLSCDFLLQGYDIRPAEVSYVHQAPPFCRLFIFFRQGAKAKIGRQRVVLQPEKIYLLPDELPFSITYEAGSELLYYHIRVVDFFGISVFGGTPKFLCCADPVALANFAAYRQEPWGVGLMNCALMAIGSLAEAKLQNMRQRAKVGQEFMPVFTELAAGSPALLRVDDLARQMGLTPAALTKRFQRKLGLSLKEFLNQQTLQRAQQMLLYTQASVAAVADALAFSDVHYFHRFFRKHTGLSPQKYRNLHGES